VSLRLGLFNLVLRLSSRYGLSELHRSENVVDGFRKHALRSDALVARFASRYDHPLITTEHSRWWWIGDCRAAKRHIVYFHGSGFCADLPATFRYWADRLATLNDASVLLVVCDGTPHCHQIFGFLPEAAIAREKLQSFIAAQT
jgi:hypothetical protein